MFLKFFIFTCMSAFLFGESSSYLDKNDAQCILHLKGSPYELGYQHGLLLKKEVAANIEQLVDGYLMANQEHPQIKPFLSVIANISRHIPNDYQEELKGLAAGAGIAYEKILLLNLIPEMFHCTGLTVAGAATAQGELYHVRVLDYSIGKNLQNTAVLMVVEPKGKIPFINVSYAGFIGCITGMNLQKIALGEIGGKGYGQWDGMPMAFLLRSVLEQATCLEDVKALLAAIPRTCEYYYVFSDGKTNRSIGVYATDRQLQYIEPGLSYALFDSSLIFPEDKWLMNHLESSPYQTVLYKDKQKEQHWGLIHHQLFDCLALTGFSHPERYPILMNRLSKYYGQINPQNLQEIIKAPVVRSSNLHNAIFAPNTLEVWIAHAGPHGELACDQTYHYFNLKNLIKN